MRNQVGGWDVFWLLGCFVQREVRLVLKMFSFLNISECGMVSEGIMCMMLVQWLYGIISMLWLIMQFMSLFSFLCESGLWVLWFLISLMLIIRLCLCILLIQGLLKLWICFCVFRFRVWVWLIRFRCGFCRMFMLVSVIVVEIELVVKVLGCELLGILVVRLECIIRLVMGMLLLMFLLKVSMLGFMFECFIVYILLVWLVLVCILLMISSVLLWLQVLCRICRNFGDGGIQLFLFCIGLMIMVVMLLVVVQGVLSR